MLVEVWEGADRREVKVVYMDEGPIDHNSSDYEASLAQRMNVGITTYEDVTDQLLEAEQVAKRRVRTEIGMAGVGSAYLMEMAIKYFAG